MYVSILFNILRYWIGKGYMFLVGGYVLIVFMYCLVVKKIDIIVMVFFFCL